MSEKPEIPEGYKKTELGIIPEEWEVENLTNLVKKIKSGGTPKSTIKKYYYGNIPFVKIEDITSTRKYLRNTKITISDEGLKNSSSWLVPEGSLLYSIYATVGEVVINKIPVATNQAIMGIIPNDKINRDYLYYFLQIFKNNLHIYFKETTQKNLTAKIVKNIEVSYPPLPEQEKIASILSKVDEQIKETERIIEKTELLKKGLMQKLFVYGTENKKLKEIDVKYSPKKWIIPENWTTKQLEEITYKITDGTHLTPKYTDKGIPFLRVKDIHSDSIDWSSVKYISKKEHNELIKRCNPKRGDILLSKNGTIGIPKIVDWDREFSIFVSLCLIKVKSKIININYLYYLLKSDMIFNQYLLRSKTGTVTNLHIEEIKNLTIIIPPLPEQEKIASILSKVDTQLQDNHNYLNKLEELKKGLMQDLLTGKVRVCV